MELAAVLEHVALDAETWIQQICVILGSRLDHFLDVWLDLASVDLPPVSGVHEFAVLLREYICFGLVLDGHLRALVELHRADWAHEFGCLVEAAVAVCSSAAN